VLNVPNASDEHHAQLLGPVGLADALVLLGVALGEVGVEVGEVGVEPGEVGLRATASKRVTVPVDHPEDAEQRGQHEQGQLHVADGPQAEDDGQHRQQGQQHRVPPARSSIARTATNLNIPDTISWTPNSTAMTSSVSPGQTSTATPAASVMMP
jgi:hypothetical protein